MVYKCDSFTSVNLPHFDLYNEMNTMLDKKLIDWNSLGQVCINTTPDNVDSFRHGVGSLYFDWSQQVNNKPKVRPVELQESDFSVLCTVFYNTAFEEVYNLLKSKYNIGRLRLMKSKPKTCLTWHTDTTKRLHYPISTQEGCLMIIGDEVKHLPENTWWLTNTLVKHTALNASMEDRIHLVASVLDEDS